MRGFLDTGSNATFISLIPEKEGADCLLDFRPISLVGSTYKKQWETPSIISIKGDSSFHHFDRARAFFVWKIDY